MKKLLPLLLIITSISAGLAQSLSEKFCAEVFHSHSDSLPYRIMYPKNFNPEQEYPLIIVLHGAGERGSDNTLQLTHGASMFANDSIRDKYPAIVIFPQCKTNSYWSNVLISHNNDGSRTFTFKPNKKATQPMALVIKLIKTIRKEQYIDKNRIYVGGLSMGGMGTFELLWREPKLFAAAFPICGGSNPIMASKYATKVNLWIFHGEMDDIVPCSHSREMHHAIIAKDGNTKLTIYPNVRHNSWENAFAEPELMPWLFSNHK